MPLFTEWGITLEEKYHVPERAIQEIEYMEVNELIQRLKKKQGKTENTMGPKTNNGDDERRVHARNER